MNFYRRFVANGTMGTHLIVVSMPSLAFSARFVEASEPICVQAFGAELAIEVFDAGVIGRLPGREKSTIPSLVAASRSEG